MSPPVAFSRASRGFPRRERDRLWKTLQRVPIVRQVADVEYGIETRFRIRKRLTALHECVVGAPVIHDRDIPCATIDAHTGNATVRVSAECRVEFDKERLGLAQR